MIILLTASNHHVVLRALKAAEKARTLFIGNLPFTTTEEELQDFFLSCGSVSSIRIPPKVCGVAYYCCDGVSSCCCLRMCAVAPYV